MASIYQLKPAFQSLLRPIVVVLARAGITANQVTVSALLLSIAAGSWLALAPDSGAALLAVPLVLLTRMALNAIDGMLAREHNMKSALGAMLNEIGDVVSDSALYLPFALIAGIESSLVVACVVLALLTELMGVVAVQIGASRRYDGPMGKSDRAFIFGLLALLLASGLQPDAWSTAFLTLAATLLVVTLFNRARRALAEIRS